MSDIFERARLAELDSILSSISLEDIASHLVRRYKKDKESIVHYLDDEFLLDHIDVTDAVKYYGNDSILCHISAYDIVMTYDEDELLEHMNVKDMDSMEDDEVLAELDDKEIFEYAVNKGWLLNNMHFVDENFLEVLREKQCLISPFQWNYLTDYIKHITL